MTNENIKICIIGIYFGELPEYFKAWLLSCSYNPSIKFLLFLDKSVSNVPKNVEIINTNLDSMKDIIQKKLNMEVNLDSAYKLCDFRPAYGIIFEDYLNEYDYWGHCDFDLMWGDIRKFVIDYDLMKYDKFLPLGHLSLYRNTEENNKRFMNNVNGISDYKKIFTDKRNYVFDEIGIRKIYEMYKYSFFDEIIFADINPKKKRYLMVTNVKYYPSIYKKYKEKYKKINYKKQLFIWEKGRVYQLLIDNNNIDKNEYLYIHMQKRNIKVNITGEDEILYLSNNEISPLPIDRSIESIIKKINPYRLSYEIYEEFKNFICHCWSYFRRRIIKIEENHMIIEKN